MNSLNVIRNNSFRKIFGCCWGESVSCLLYYCKTLSMSYILLIRESFCFGNGP